MAKADDVKVKIQGLIDKANATTGKSDKTLTEGVYSLMQGYGSGEGGVKEIPTEAEMTSLLTTAEVGSVVKYTGESTETYEKDALYIVEAVSE